MKMNRKLVLILALVLSVAVATTGTLAYLTDHETETNVFTVGNVDIDLTEDFEQGATLVPGTKITKVPVITNTGKTDAWVWMTVAIPAGMEDESGDASKNLLHWNWMAGTDARHMNSKGQDSIDTYIDNEWLPEGTTIEQVRAGDNWTVDEKTPIAVQTIDGVAYNVYLFKYNTVLVPGETTLGSFCQVYMDTRVDIAPDGELYWVENGNAKKLNYNINTMGNPKIFVAAYGMQANGFDTVDAAYKAYGEQWGDDNNADYNLPIVAAPTAGSTRPAGYIPSTEGGVLDNLIVLDDSTADDNLRAMYNGEGGASNYLTEDLIINNSYLDGTYAINLYAVEAENVNLIANKTTFAGWSSYTGFDSVTFTDCTFRENSNHEIWNVVRPYDDTTFVNCEFHGTQLFLDKLAGATVTMENCTFDGEPITAAILAEMVTEGSTSSVTLK
ncbi:MAG: hypothetical protein E7326_03490 [Clostridiales bacterium]|nr:hypothetical protein [Clostridiales bacterium]